LTEQGICGALNTAQDVRKAKKVDLIVIRVTKTSKLANARPCYNCLKMMQDIGINKVFYSTGTENEMIYETVKNMVSIQASSVSRYLYRLSNNIADNKNRYFEELIKKLFPKQIKLLNLEYFIEYNFKNLLPNYNIVIKKTDSDKIVIIYDDNNNFIISSIII
jgi:hypothetical protein